MNAEDHLRVLIRHVRHVIETTQQNRIPEDLNVAILNLAFTVVDAERFLDAAAAKSLVQTFVSVEPSDGFDEEVLKAKLERFVNHLQKNGALR